MVLVMVFMHSMDSSVSWVSNDADAKPFRRMPLSWDARRWPVAASDRSARVSNFSERRQYKIHHIHFLCTFPSNAKAPGTSPRPECIQEGTETFRYAPPGSSPQQISEPSRRTFHPIRTHLSRTVRGGMSLCSDYQTPNQARCLKCTLLLLLSAAVKPRVGASRRGWKSLDRMKDNTAC